MEGDTIFISAAYVARDSRIRYDLWKDIRGMRCDDSTAVISVACRPMSIII